MSMRIERTGPRRPWQETLGEKATAVPQATPPPAPKIDYDKELPHLRKIATVLQGFGDIYNRFESQGMEHIPADGPALIVFYHALVPLDAWYFAMTFYLKTGRVIHGLGDRWLFRLPGMKQLAQAVGIVEASPENARKLLNEGRLVAVSPGGVREGFAGADKQYTLQWGRRRGFAELILETEVPVIPAFSENAEQMFSSPFTDRPFFKHLYEKTKLPLMPIFGLGFLPFPVAVKTWLGQPLQFSKADTVESVRERTRAALQDLIDRHQRRSTNVIDALRERFRGPSH